MTAGEDFIRKIRPIGCACFIILAILVTIICFTAGKDPIKGYSAPQSTEYYAGHLEELKAELEENVFPNIDGVAGCEIDGSVVAVYLEKDDLAVSRSAILRYFDKSLFDFREAKSDAAS